MDFHACFFILFFILSLFVSTWGLKSEPIIGTEPVQLEKHRYYVILITVTVVSTTPFDIDFGSCGAAIITDKLAVTAGHCLKNGPWKFMLFAVPPSSHPFELLQDEKNQDYYRVSDAYIRKQPNPDNITQSFDIGVVRINGEFKHSSFFPHPTPIELLYVETNYARIINPVFLGTGQNELGYTDDNLTLTNRNGEQDFKLRESIQEIYASGCQWELRPDEKVKCNQPEIFCTATQSIEPDGVISPGDSGGPLVYDGKLIGVASSASAYSSKYRSIAIFVNIAYHQNFLDNITKGFFDPDITEEYKFKYVSSAYIRYEFQKSMTNNSLKKRCNPLTVNENNYV